MAKELKKKKEKVKVKEKTSIAVPPKVPKMDEKFPKKKMK